MGTVQLVENYAYFPFQIGIYIKNNIPNFADINEVFDIISKSGLPNSIGFNTMFEGAINSSNEIQNTGDLYKLVAPPSFLPLPVNRTTVSLNHLQQGNFKGTAPFPYTSMQRNIGQYFKVVSETNEGMDQSGLRSTNVNTVLKYDRGEENSSFLVTDRPDGAKLVNGLNSTKLKLP